MDLTDLRENTYEYGIQSTPIKNQSSPSIPYASPSIPYTSPSWNRSLQTPIHDRSTSGTV